MIQEKNIQARIAEILTDAGFNVVASEIDEGFQKPAVFIKVVPSEAKLLACGGATEEITDSIEIKYISALETVADCIYAAHRIKELFLYKPFNIQDRHLTINELEFNIEKGTLYLYFDITFIQTVDRDENFDDINELVIRGEFNGIARNFN